MSEPDVRVLVISDELGSADEKLAGTYIEDRCQDPEEENEPNSDVRFGPPYMVQKCVSSTYASTNHSENIHGVASGEPMYAIWAQSKVMRDMPMPEE